MVVILGTKNVCNFKFALLYRYILIKSSTASQNLFGKYLVGVILFLAICSANTLNSLLQILPFMLAGLLIAIIAGQRESARRRALSAEQEKQERASLLEAVFDSITDSIFIYDEHELIHRSNSAARQLLTFTNRPNYSSHSSTERTAILSICDEDDAPLPEKEFPAPLQSAR
jgi:PAS domain-containing protein